MTATQLQPRPQPQRKIVITWPDRRWNVEIIGHFTRRELQSLNRAIRVAYSQTERKRLVETRKVQRAQELAQAKSQEDSNNER